MSSPNGKMAIDKLPSDRSPSRKSSRNHSTDTLRTKRSHRSPSRERRDGRRDRDSYSSHRSRDKYRDRDRRSRSRDRIPRDRDYDRGPSRRRERDSHRGDRDRDRGESRLSNRDRDRDGRDHRDRRRKRDDDAPGSPDAKRKRSDDGPEDGKLSLSPKPPRDGSRHSRNPRDDFEEHPRYRRGEPRPPVDEPPRPPSPPPIRASPTYEQPPEEYNPEEPKDDDSEARSVFVSQLAARLTARDLGYFFEDKLGEGTVLDSRIVTDRISRRSKGIGYVEFRSVENVEQALGLNGTIVMGLPISVQYTEAERNRTHAGDGNLNLPPGVSHRGGMQLYVGSLHFNLTESDIKQVFEPFGELEFVDLHRDPVTGRSKGYAFVQYKRGEDAKMALEQMEGFELAGRQLRVNTVHDKGTGRYTVQDSLEDTGGGNLNAASRQALMQKLARVDSAPVREETNNRPNIPDNMTSRSVVLKNMFDPEQESGRDWDKELAEDVKGECEEKYGKIESIKVERESQGEIYIQFSSVQSASAAIDGLNGRWFGGKQVSASFISDAIMQFHR